MSSERLPSYLSWLLLGGRVVFFVVYQFRLGEELALVLGRSLSVFLVVIRRPVVTGFPGVPLCLELFRFLFLSPMGRGVSELSLLIDSPGRL